MNRGVMLCGLALSSLAIDLPAAAEDPTPLRADVRVDLRNEQAAIPPSLHGIFIEDINHAVDGGLYGELVQNRSFEEGVVPPGMRLVDAPDGSKRIELSSLPPDVPESRRPMPWPWRENLGWDPARAMVGWTLRAEPAGAATATLTDAHPMNAASSRSLEIAIPNPARADLVNSGYWGIPVAQGTSYRLRFFLRAGSFAGKVAARLESHEGKVIACHDFPEVHPDEGWHELTATLISGGTDPEARLVLSLRGRGTLQVDFVSLFPPTFRDRPNGLRRDLARYLEELKPSFVRWPGGCFVEGFSWESAPDFRRTIGPPETRPGMYQYWKYRSTDGFGYHEFLQLCEDLGAMPVYAVFGGMTVHPDNNVPPDQLQPWIQNALDAIEYAVGPATSRWGAERAKMGHPEPFTLKYVEIGNEHETPLYGDYYAKFRDAIKAKYPDMTVIMSMYWSGLNRRAIARAGDANIDMLDEHAYNDARWVRANTRHFDRYPRKPWSILVGEYAARPAAWEGGLGDSIYLMMFERNADLVKMACYAPLFVNIHDRSWAVNLIEFDGPRSFAHGSYYVQKVFAENRPDVNLASVQEVSPKPDPAASLLAGRIGLGTWSTQAEFKELRVYDESGKLILQDDFADLARWETPGHGHWQAMGGVLKQTDLRESPAMLLLKDLGLKSGRIEVKARRTGGREGFLIFFNAEDRERHLFANYGANGNEFSAIQARTMPEGLEFRGESATPGPIDADRWYDLRVTVGMSTAEMFLDGKKVSAARVTELPWFFSQAGLDRGKDEVIVKATNFRASPVEATIQIDGAKSIGAPGRLIAIEGASLATDNDFDDPTRITSRERPLPGLSPRFTVRLAPYSANVLRVPVQR